METNEQTKNYTYFSHTAESQVPMKPKSRLGLSIVATIVGFSSVYMCCIAAIMGAIAIVFATQSNTQYNRENYSGAQTSSQVALILSILSFVISFVSILIFIFFYAIGEAVSIGDLQLGIDGAIIDRLR